MITRMRALLCLIFLIGCTTQPDAIVESTQSSSASPFPALSSSKGASSSPLLQVTPELSIESLAAMRLEGTDLRLVKTLDDNAAYTRHEIRYVSNGLTISGILNVPKGDGPFPLLILNHGYIDPDVYTIGRGLKREQDFLARRGFAVLHTDYRKHGASDPSPDVRETYDAGLEYAMDAINAVHAVRANPPKGVDASRVGMMGHSMGGGVSLNIATAHPDLVDAFVLYAPVHADAWENYARWRRDREPEDQTLTNLGTRETHPELWDRLSSQTYLDRIEAPILLFQGTRDTDVPVAWSDTLDASLTAENKEREYVRYEGEGHEFGPRWTDFMNRTADFFDRELR